MREQQERLVRVLLEVVVHCAGGVAASRLSVVSVGACKPQRSVGALAGVGRAGAVLVRAGCVARVGHAVGGPVCAVEGVDVCSEAGDGRGSVRVGGVRGGAAEGLCGACVPCWQRPARTCVKRPRSALAFAHRIQHSGGEWRAGGDAHSWGLREGHRIALFGLLCAQVYSCPTRRWDGGEGGSPQLLPAPTRHLKEKGALGASAQSQTDRVSHGSLLQGRRGVRET